MQFKKYNIIIIFSFLITTICHAQKPMDNNSISNLTLDQVMEIADKNSMDVRSAATELNYLKDSEVLTYFNLGPSLNARANLSFAPGQTESTNTNQPSQSENITLTLTQPITEIVQNSFKINQKAKLRKAAEFDLISERIKAREKAAELYINSQQAYRNIEIKRTEQTQVGEQLNETKTLYESGDENKTKIDLLQLQAKYIESEISLSRAVVDLQNKTAELKSFLALNSNITLAFEDKSYWEAKNKTIENLNVLIEKGKNGRFEIKNLENKISAEKSNFIQSSFEYLPKINFFASYAYDNSSQSNSSENPSVSFYPQKTIKYGLNFNWNIWDGGIVADSQMSSLNKKRKLIIEKEKTGFKINQEIVLAYNDFKNYNTNLSKAKSVVEVSEEALKLSQIKYKSGDLTASELILVQNALTNSKINLALLRSNLDITWVKLQASLGEIPKIN
ncbi:TolC family protein [Fluviispira multicolorata]|uniref:Outer membrane protein TolC n=1 Tax=Fluviispira multicolorata TaxID=2654512 RepID=A0A833N4F6_9BACT|nr:TolC family protein [Fluviispira multicolorata]KAB8030786.1 hypothetical protein GCL57_07375 [Fluviispira multicolorata]